MDYSTGYIIKVDGEEMPEDWKMYISDIDVNLQEQAINKCLIKINYTSKAMLLPLVFVEGAYVDVFFLINNQLNERSRVFTGLVKTVSINYGDNSTISIECFEELFLLDFSDEPIEVEKSNSENPFSITNMIDTVKEGAVEAYSAIVNLFDTKDEIAKPKSSMYNFCNQLKERYPCIKKIHVEDVTYAYDEKTIETSSESDYRKLMTLAKKNNRTVNMINGELYVTRKNEVITQPFIFSPPNIQYDTSIDDFYIKSISGNTSLSGITSNLNVYSSNSKALGQIMEKMTASESLEETLDLEISLPKMEEEKTRLEEFFKAQIGTKQEEQAKTNYDNYVVEYDKIKAEEEKEYNILIKALSKNKMYCYEIIDEFNNGSPVKVYEENNNMNSQDLKEFIKEKFINNQKKFLDIGINLKMPNTLLRTWNRVVLLIFDVNGRCNGYNKRFSGEYNIKSVNFKYDNQGFVTSFRCFRNFIIKE